MTFLQRFAEVKERLNKADTSKLKEQFALQVTLTDQDCHGVFYIANTDQGFMVEPYDYQDHTAHIIIDSHDLMEILDHSLDAVGAYLDGRVIVEGNLDHVKLMTKLKEKAKRKTTSTTATTKKEAGKTTAATKKTTTTEKKTTAAKKPKKETVVEKLTGRKSKSTESDVSDRL